MITLKAQTLQCLPLLLTPTPNLPVVFEIKSSAFCGPQPFLMRSLSPHFFHFSHLGLLHAPHRPKQLNCVFPSLGASYSLPWMSSATLSKCNLVNLVICPLVCIAFLCNLCLLCSTLFWIPISWAPCLILFSPVALFLKQCPSVGLHCEFDSSFPSSPQGKLHKDMDFFNKHCWCPVRLPILYSETTAAWHSGDQRHVIL